MDEEARASDDRIAAREAVPEDGTLLFRARKGEDTVEGILLPVGDEVVAYENYCQHWTDVRLDTGSGAAFQNGEIVCEKHGAYFETDTGFCTFGPCEGAVLAAIEVTVADGEVYLTDDEYAFVGRGPIEDGDAVSGADDHDLEDLSSGSRIGFSGN